ncbi:hypothetical protein [Nocardia sp. NPDC020380]|uniref:hypothetical protein n=1 Tax=Nocardia sp. NPDC020380 TaxID=3364309 RepID=UPI00379FACEB
MLTCSHCTHTSFVSINDITATFRCRHCLHDNVLTSARWRTPLDEPRWFYHLHPTARALISENGHVPLLLSRHLRLRSRTFTDSAEFKMTDPTVADGENKDKCETDLLSLADRRLAVAEAKSNNKLGSSRAERNAAVDKRLYSADVLQADEIIMATTQAAWQPESITAMTEKIRWHHRGNPLPPRIRLRTITGLGSDSVGDEYIPI